MLSAVIPKIVPFIRQCRQMWWEGEEKQTIWRMRDVCHISKPTRAQSHARANAPTPTCTYARTRMHLPTNTQKYVLLIAFPRQQRFRERASMLRYTYIACLVGLWIRGIIEVPNRQFPLTTEKNHEGPQRVRERERVCVCVCARARASRTKFESGTYRIKG